jgi:CO/xanthine dehydrogenase Mo-binding subunit
VTPVHIKDFPARGFSPEVETGETFEYLGKGIPRIESASKARGSTTYIDDMVLPGMLYGKILRSPHPHARVVRIDKTRAESLPGVRFVMTSQDVTRILGEMPVIGAVPPRNYPVLSEEPRYVGDEVAAVAAVDEETAEKAVRLIEVEYEKLPAVLDPEKAMDPEAVRIHGDERNIRDQKRVRIGNAEKALKQSDCVVKARFRTSKHAHVAIEPHGCISNYDLSAGQLTHWICAQKIYPTCIEMGGLLKIPASKVRVILPEGMGAGFGGKDGCLPMDIIAALMSMKLGKPIKIILSREEVFMATYTRHPYIIEAELGLKQDGTIVAWKEKTVVDIGAYGNLGELVAIIGQACMPGSYKIPNISVDSYLVYTNKQFCGPFRGFGNPQVTFARESLLDMGAKKLKIDPVDLRLRNLIKPEDLPYTTSSGLVIRSCGIEACVKKAAEAIGWGKKRKTNTGVGIACTMHITGTKYGPHDIDVDYVAADVVVYVDGSAVVHTGSPDIGEGINTVLAQVAAEALGIRLEKVAVASADSQFSPPDGGCFASKGAFARASAVHRAAAEARGKLLRVAGKMLEADPKDLVARQGKIHVRADPGREVAISDVAAAAYFTAIDGGGEPIIGHGTWISDTRPVDENGYGNISPAYTFAANAAEVEVDPETGQVKVLNYVAAQDNGRTLNVDIVEGQIHGGAAQGIGYGLYEDMIYGTETGQHLNPFLLDYKIPTAADVPDIETIITETIEPENPLGSKGAGEIGLNCAAPAVANAIADAIGVRMKDLPMTPVKIVNALEQERNG